uniref:Integrase catalytic domain-containing protein n=1 Tax=Octopus bimaculoides TaxID=37653 RepID=A0A0L8HA74_OCTBM
MVLNSYRRSSGIFHTSSPHYPQGNGEAEHAAQTVKNLLKKASDPYIAMLNYCSTPLQHGKSPAELLMNRKLRTRIPTIFYKNVSCQENVEQHKNADSRLKLKQKVNFNKRHRATERSSFTEEQPVWMKTPKTSPAKVVKTLSPRSVLVEADSGLLIETEAIFTSEVRKPSFLRYFFVRVHFYLVTRTKSEECSSIPNLYKLLFSTCGDEVNWKESTVTSTAEGALSEKEVGVRKSHITIVVIIIIIIIIVIIVIIII